MASIGEFEQLASRLSSLNDSASVRDDPGRGNISSASAGGVSGEP